MRTPTQRKRERKRSDREKKDLNADQLREMLWHCQPDKTSHTALNGGRGEAIERGKRGRARGRRGRRRDTMLVSLEQVAPFPISQRDRKRRQNS